MLEQNFISRLWICLVSGYKFWGKSEPQPDPPKEAKPQSSAKEKEIDILKEKERIKNEALDERLQLEVKAEKEKALARVSNRSFHRSKVDWGNSDGFDSFGLGE
jgi:hypothetical protein